MRYAAIAAIFLGGSPIVDAMTVHIGANWGVIAGAFLGTLMAHLLNVTSVNRAAEKACTLALDRHERDCAVYRTKES